jgi:hypothetical protein
MRFRSVLLGALGGVLLIASGDARAEDPPKEAPKEAAKEAPKDPGKKGDAAKAPAASKSEIETAVWKTIMASAPMIDGCTESYVAEFPEAKGQAQLSTTVVKDGSVSKVNVSTALQGARNLGPCLEKAAKTWRFPKLNEKTESVQLSLAVQVRKGVKFQMRKPGEKEPEQKPQPGYEDEGFIQFLPSGWVENPQ